MSRDQGTDRKGGVGVCCYTTRAYEATAHTTVHGISGSRANLITKILQTYRDFSNEVRMTCCMEEYPTSNLVCTRKWYLCIRRIVKMY